MSASNPEKRFRIAFSFAGEKRDFVEVAAEILAKVFGKEQILYDKYHEAEFARTDLGMYLPKLYSQQSDLIVPVLCSNYDDKRWTGWEWVHIYSLITKQDNHRIMPARFDYAIADGLSAACGFVELDAKTPAQFADLILQRLAINQGKPNEHYRLHRLDSNLLENQGIMGSEVGALNTKASTENNQKTRIVDVHHQTMATRLLSESKSYFQCLIDEFPNRFPETGVPRSERAMVEFFLSCPPEQVKTLFFLVRRSLKVMVQANINDSVKNQAYQAVSAMYCLAAMQLVNKEAHQQGHYLVKVPRDENIICAIIATALFGGELHLQLTDQIDLPDFEYAFQVTVPAVGDRLQLGLERAIYTALRQNKKGVLEAALDCQPLTPDELNDLLELLETIKEIEQRCLVLVVKAHSDFESSIMVANKYQIPMMFPTNEVSSILLGMEAGRLLAGIKQFWRELNEFHPHAAMNSCSEKIESKSSVALNINAPAGTVVVSTGNNSAAQSGSLNTANTK